MREPRVEALAGPAGLAVADVVRQNEVKPGGIEKLAFAKEFAREFGPEKIAAVAGCAMENENSVLNDSVLVAPRRANGAIVHFQFRQRLAGIKMEIMEYEIAGSRCGVVRDPAISYSMISIFI